jgi:type I restriction enzyme, S subunit
MNQEEILIPYGWRKTSVGDEIELAYGKNLPKPERISGDFPVYGSNGIVGTHNKFLIDFPSIVIGRKGTVGAIHKTTTKFWPTDVSFYVKIKDPTNLRLDFTHYLLSYLNLPKYAQSGVKSGLNRNDVYKIIFPLPSISTQKQIVQKLDDILGELEVKKKQIISLIEQNKERINFFKKNWINHIISSLIPRKKLLDGWLLTPLSEVCKVERGKFGHRPRNDPDYYGGKYPFIQTGIVANSNGRVKTYSQTLNEKGFKTSRIFPKGTVVITIAANIGDTAILEFDACMPDSLIGITPILGKTIPEYIEYALRLYQKELTHDAPEGAQKNINYKFLKPLLIPIPKTIDIQKQIVQNIKSAEEKFQSQKEQFERIKEFYESQIKYINHIQSSILDSAFSGKLIN